MFGDRERGLFTYGPFSSDGDLTRAIGQAEGIIHITDVFLVNSASAATHATNYVTYQLINMGTDGAGTTVIATASTSQTGGAAIAANVPYPLTITGANKAVADGEIIGFVRNEQNTDAPSEAAEHVTVRYVQVGAPQQ